MSPRVLTAAPRPARCLCVQAAGPGAGHRGALCWCALGGWRAPRGWRAGPVIWGSTSRHLCRWRGPVLQRQREGRQPSDEGGGGGKGRGELCWDGNKANSKAGNKKEGVSVIARRRLPPALPASLLHHPVSSPLQPFPFPSEHHGHCPSACGSSSDSQAERIIRIMASPDLSRCGSPGSLCAPDTQTIPGALRLQLPPCWPRKDTKQKKTNQERGGEANGAQWPPRTSFLGASFHPQ